MGNLANININVNMAAIQHGFALDMAVDHGWMSG
jgi:hypothetical protein